MEVFPMSIIIGIDHGYYAIKTAHCSFPAGLTSYGEHEPYTRQGLLAFGGCFFVCGSGRQPMLVTLDAIYNRVIQNRKKGRRTWIFCDEFYILFRYEYSANFFYKLWKRIRKYNGLVTGLTQNVDELLRSDTARLMLANSEFLVMLNQSATDRAELAKLLNISDNQLGYVTNVPAGCGLIRCAGNIVPFTNSFPKDTKLYKLMSTNPYEKKE